MAVPKEIVEEEREKTKKEERKWRDFRRAEINDLLVRIREDSRVIQEVRPL